MNMPISRRMKKCVAWIMAVVMLSGMTGNIPLTGKAASAAAAWNGYVATSYDAGDGSKDNPYQIRWGSQLAYLAQNVRNGETYENRYFVLTGDILLNSVTDPDTPWDTWSSSTEGLNSWNSIGEYKSADDNRPFAGTFDGEGHTVSGLWTCTRTTNGLFGYSTGVIKNVNVEKSYIEGSGYGVGGIVGKNDGTVTDCSNAASIVSVWADASNIEAGSAGGVAGTNTGAVTYSHNTGTVDGVGVSGGVTGTNLNTVLNCYNEGVIGRVSPSQYGTGGIAGCNSREAGVVRNCYNRGEVAAVNYAGGIVGTNLGGIVNCYNQGNVTVSQNGGYCGTVAGALERAGFDSCGKVSYSYWKNDISPSEPVGYTGEGTFTEATCRKYGSDYTLYTVSDARTGVDFTIDESSETADRLADALDKWTQAKNCGSKEVGIARWTSGSDGPVFASEAADTWNGNAATSYGGGDGSAGSPYRITNGEQLKFLANQVNGGNAYSGDHFVLASDIVLNDESFVYDPDTGLIHVSDGINEAYYGTGIKGDDSAGNSQFDTTPSVKGKWYILGLSGYESGSYAGIINPWTPVGTANKVFAGSFDGRGHTISGLFIENYMYAGLFGYADGVNIADVNIKDSVAVSSDRGYTGIAAGYLNGNVSRCNITDSIAASTAEGYVGGITGYAADAPLGQDGSYKENHKIFGSSYGGDVYGAGYAGGIAGYSGYGNIIDECNTTEQTTVRGNAKAIGGICGRNYGTSIINTYNMADVSGGGSAAFAGGIAGENASEGKSCIEGFADVFGVIANCYNRGNVTGGTGSYTGGIAGYNFGGTITNVYNEAAVSGGTSGSIAGVNGISDGAYTMYEGLTRQKYKNTPGTICYTYSASAACGKNNCDDMYINNTALFAGSSYSLPMPVLECNTVNKALNAWIKSPGDGLGNDPSNAKYLTWVFNTGSYPKLSGTHYTETTDTEPYPEYELTYDANCSDAEGSMDSIIYELTLPGTPESEKPVVKDTGYSREGYNFVEWNTESDGSGTSYQPGDHISIEKTTTLYAIWISTQAVITSAEVSGRTATVTWDSVDDAAGYWVYRYRLRSAGDSFTEFTSKDKIDEVSVTDVTQSEYTYVDKDLEVGTYYYGIRAYSIVDNGATATYVFKPFSEAACVKVEYNNLTYNGNGNTGGDVVEPVKFVKGTEVTVADNTFTKDGYVFGGWNTQDNGAGTMYQPGDVITADADMELYAVWELAPVNDLNASMTDNDAVLLTWSKNAAADATGYRVYCSKNDNSHYKLMASVPKESADTVKYVTEPTEASTTYYYKVTVYRDSSLGSGTYSEESTDSNEVSITTEAMLSLDTTKGAVNDNEKTGIAGKKVYLTWDEQRGVTGYQVFRSSSADSYGALVGTVNGSVNNTFEDEVPNEGTYYYHFRTYTEIKDSTSGQINNVEYGKYSRTLTVEIRTIVVTFNSNIKSNMEVKKQITGRNFIFSLDANTFTNEGFAFDEWNTSPDKTGTSYSDKEECHFDKDITLYAIWRLNPPANLAAAILDGKMTLTWDSNSAASGYQVYRQTNGGDYELVDTVVPSQNATQSYTIGEFDTSMTYRYFIKAFLNDELVSGRYVTVYSDASNEVTVAPTAVPEGQVQNVSCMVNPDGGHGSYVRITWDAVAGAAGYRIYRSDTAGSYGERIDDVRGNSYLDVSVDSHMPGEYYYYVRAYVEDEDGVYYKAYSEPCRAEFEKVKLTYRPNGGQGDIIEDYVIMGSSDIQVRDCTYTREGYQFTGWYGTINDTEISYKTDIDEQGNNDSISAEVLESDVVLNARWKLNAVTGLEASRNDDNTVELTWNGNASATGYDVYQRKGLNGNFEHLGTTGDSRYVTEAIDNTSMYYYYIVAYEDIELPSGLLKSAGVESETVTVEPGSVSEGQVTGLSGTIKNDTVSLTWDKVDGVSGYYIYRSSNKDGRGELIATVESGDTVEYLDEKVESVGTYYYSIRAYVTTDNALYYKPWSEVIDVTFEECNITYIANNMTEDKVVMEYIAGADVTVIQNTFMYSGRTFVSWNTDPLGKGYEYVPGNNYRVESDLTLYAVWKLDKPANVVAAVNDAGTGIELTWDKVVGADGYLVCRKSEPDGAVEERGSVTDNSYIDHNDGKELGPDDGYYYFVRAYEIIDENTRRYSDSSDITNKSVVGNAVVEEPDPVGKATNLTVLEFYERSARIGWSGVPAADGYFVYRSIGADGERVRTGDDIKGSNVNTTELELDTPYYYYVVAYIMDSANDTYILGDYSEGLLVMITSSPAPSPSPTPLPTATPNPYGKVTNLTAESVEEGVVNLKWDDMDNVTGFRVYNVDNDAGDNMTLCRDVSGCSLTISNLEEGRTYYYCVRGYQAKVGVGFIYSDMSDIVSVKVKGTLVPTPEPTTEPTLGPTVTPTITPSPTSNPTSSPTAAPTGTPEATASPTSVPDLRVNRFLVKDAYGKYINLIWDKNDNAAGYEISYSTTIDGVRNVVAVCDGNTTSLQSVEVTGAAFTVNENINAGSIQAYNQYENAVYYYYIRAIYSEGFAEYSAPILIQLHVFDYNTPTPAPSVTASPEPSPGADSVVEAGDIVKVSNLRYKVLTNEKGKRTVSVARPVKKTYKSVKIPSTIKINGVTYKVTEIAANAFKGNSKLKKVIIGSNIKKIGKRAFYKCTKLSSVTFKGKKITAMGKKLFYKIGNKCKMVIPKAVLKKYRRMIKASK